MNVGAVKCRITGNSGGLTSAHRPATTAGFANVKNLARSEYIRRFSYNCARGRLPPGQWLNRQGSSPSFLEDDLLHIEDLSVFHKTGSLTSIVRHNLVVT